MVFPNGVQLVTVSYLERHLTDELNPDGTLETLIFNRLLRASRDLRRVERMEAEQAADGLDDNFNLFLERLARYKMRAERSFYRAHREIQALQAERRAQAEDDDPVRFGKEPWRLEWIRTDGQPDAPDSAPYNSDASPDTDSPPKS